MIYSDPVGNSVIVYIVGGGDGGHVEKEKRPFRRSERTSSCRPARSASGRTERFAKPGSKRKHVKHVLKRVNKKKPAQKVAEKAAKKCYRSRLRSDILRLLHPSKNKLMKP